MDFERGACGIEVFVRDFAFVAAIDGVSVFRFEIIQVQAVGTASDFFVRRKADPDITVAGKVFVAATFGVAVCFGELFHGGHDFGDARFVVCAEERRAVGRDERAALEPLERREIIDFERCSRACEQYVGTVVIFDDLRFRILARKVRRCVHVADETDWGVFFTPCGSRQKPIDVAVFIHFYLRKPDIFQFFDQVFCEFKLLMRARTSFTRFVRRCRITDVL